MSGDATGQHIEPLSSYLICTLPRSGSWLLAEGLRQTGLLGQPEEYFWTDLRELYTKNWSLSPDTADHVFLAHARRAGTSPNGVFGAKVHWFEFEQLAAMLRRGEPRRDPQLTARRHRQRQQADHELITQFLPDVRYVHLTRADKVAQAISWHRALQTLDWWDLGRPRPARAGTDPQFDGDAIEQLESRLRADEWRWVSYFADVGVQPIIVTYESLSSDYEGTIRSVAAQLGVDTDDREIPQPKLRRQSDTISKKWHSSYLRRRNRRIQRLHRSLPPVSVIVVSHNEGENLRRTVDVLSATVPETVELLVVDDHSTDGSAAFLAGNDRVRVVIPPEPGGVAGARNHGAREATGDVLVFSDAHVDPTPGWLSPLCTAFDDPSVAAVAPAVSAAARRNDMGFGFTWADPSLRLQWLASRPPSSTAVPFIGGCFMVFRRIDFERVGGFDEGMVTWGSEDAEICLNLWRRGRGSVVVPESHVVVLFPPAAPYEVGWRDTVHNTLRLATVHFGPEATRRIVRQFCGWEVFAPAYADLLDSDVWQRREVVRSESLHDDEWFFDRFRIAALN